MRLYGARAAIFLGDFPDFCRAKPSRSMAELLDPAWLLACSFERWYPKLKGVSIRSAVIRLDPAFVDLILADGVYDSEPHDRTDGATVSADAAAAAERCAALISEKIAQLGGAVFPKLNWSAPTDAAWMLGGSIKCTSARDVLLLLQSSDRVSHDLCEARRACAPDHGAWDEHSWVLALRAWREMEPSHEFRCFRGGDGRLLGASQRDRGTHYPFLEPMRAQLLEALHPAPPSPRTPATRHCQCPPSHTCQMLDRFQRKHLVGVGPDR